MRLRGEEKSNARPQPLKGSGYSLRRKWKTLAPHGVCRSTQLVMVRPSTPLRVTAHHDRLYSALGAEPEFLGLLEFFEIGLGCSGEYPGQKDYDGFKLGRWAGVTS